MESITRFHVIVYLMTSSLLMVLIVSTAAHNETQQLNNDIIITMQEMQRANYFTFVMLLNMVQDKIPPNATFLVPSDRALSKASVLEDEVLEFLLRHSIPSPLSFQDLERLPTGTVLPTYQKDYTLSIINIGRKEFYINNVRLSSINICTAGSSFRCHGIYGVLNASADNLTTASTCSHVSPPAPAAVRPSPAPSQTSAPPFTGSTSLAPVANPAVVDVSQNTSSDRLRQRLFTTIVSCLILVIVKLRF